MKYIVGYPVKSNDSFLDSLIENRSSIREVYFSFGDMPNGRSRLICDSETEFERQVRQTRDLKRLSSAGLDFNLLLNANCYGRDSSSRAFFNKIGDLTDYIIREYGLSSVTTASLLIAKFMKENFPSIDVRASVNMDIGTVEGLEYVEGYFDSFYVRRDLNRNMPALLKLKQWCDSHSKTMYLLANSGCLNNCSAHVFHDNLVAHEAEMEQMDNGYSFEGVCWEYLSKPENHSSWLQRTGFIRPEDVSDYEGVVSAMKLATRVNSSPSRILEAYVGASYRGAVTELLEPNHTGAFYPKYIDNSKFPKGYSAKVLYCDKKCSECDYCKNALETATVKLINDPSIKV